MDSMVLCSQKGLSVLPWCIILLVYLNTDMLNIAS
jgi:hypothetical protein